MHSAAAVVVVADLGTRAETVGGAGMRPAGWKVVEERRGIVAVLVVEYSLSGAGGYPCAGHAAAAAGMAVCASLPRTCCALRRQI